MTTTTATTQYAYSPAEAGPTSLPTGAPVTTRRPARVDQARFAAGAALSVGIAALTALIGIVVTRGILHLHVLDSGALAYTLAVAGIAIVAGLLFDAALHIAPHPQAYFGAIVALATVLAVAIPFATPAVLGVQAALAGMNLAVGLVIGFLVPLAADSARR